MTGLLFLALAAPAHAERQVLASELDADFVFDARTGLILDLKGPSAEEPEWPAMRARTLMGKEVVDRLHREFGEVADLVVDLDEERVLGALVNRLDDWAPGTELVWVPIEAFSLPPDLGEKAALNYSRERWE